MRVNSPQEKPKYYLFINIMTKCIRNRPMDNANKYRALKKEITREQYNRKQFFNIFLKHYMTHCSQTNSMAIKVNIFLMSI